MLTSQISTPITTTNPKNHLTPNELDVAVRESPDAMTSSSDFGGGGAPLGVGAAAPGPDCGSPSLSADFPS